MGCCVLLTNLSYWGLMFETKGFWLLSTPVTYLKLRSGSL